jgi:hypothetical protein
VSARPDERGAVRWQHRLRLTARADLTDGDVELAAAALRAVARTNPGRVPEP